MVIAFDIDEHALAVCQNNVRALDVESQLEMVNCDILQCCSTSRWHALFDTVITNPPFGTKNNTGLFLAPSSSVLCC